MKYDDTFFDEGTPLAVRAILLQYMGSPARLRLWYGDQDTGKAWDEEHEVTGYINRTGGQRKAPLLISRSNAYGGGTILTARVIRIDHIQGHCTLYKHPKFDAGKWEAVAIAPLTAHGKTYIAQARRDGEEVANFAKMEQAQRYIDFMTGKRYSK